MAGEGGSPPWWRPFRPPTATTGGGSAGTASLGAGLYLGGLALGVIALGVFLWSAGLSPADPAFWPAREAAFATAAVGLSAFLLGVNLLLPVGRRTIFAAAGGELLCLGAVGFFVRAYPAAWGLAGAADATVPAIALYATGLSAIAGSTWIGLRGAVSSRDGDTGDAATETGGPDREAEERAVTPERGPFLGGRSTDADAAPLEALESDCLRRLFRDHDDDG